MDAALNPGTGADHSPAPAGLRRRCKNCRINSGIPTRSRYGTRAPITTICGPSNPPTRLSSTANGVATAIATHNPLRQDPTTPLKRRCASNPTSRPPRKNRSSPDSMAGIANSTSAGSQESMEPKRTRASKSCRHRIRCQTALASSSNAIEKKRKLLKDRCSWILQFKRVVFSMQYPTSTLASAQILFRRCPHGNRILAQPDRDVTAAPETTLVLPPGLDSYRTCRGTGNQSTFQRRCKPQRRRPRRLPPWA